MGDSAGMPRAYAGSGATDDNAIRRAVMWAREQLPTVGGGLLLHVPQKKSLSRDTTIGTLAKSLPVASWTARNPAGWTGGVVISVWPDRQHLAEIDDSPLTRALVVVSWLDEDVTAWLGAHHPTALAAAPPAGPTISDPVVIKGLTTLTALVNHGNNLAGALDKRDAINVLTLLHRNGHVLDPDAIYAWALAEPRWQARGAERLRELAASIAAGGRPRGGDSAALQPDLLERWRREARDD